MVVFWPCRYWPAACLDRSSSLAQQNLGTRDKNSSNSRQLQDSTYQRWVRTGRPALQLAPWTIWSAQRNQALHQTHYRPGQSKSIWLLVAAVGGPQPLQCQVWGPHERFPLTLNVRQLWPTGTKSEGWVWWEEAGNCSLVWMHTSFAPADS